MKKVMKLLCLEPEVAKGLASTSSELGVTQSALVSVSIQKLLAELDMVERNKND